MPEINELGLWIESVEDQLDLLATAVDQRDADAVRRIHRQVSVTLVAHPQPTNAANHRLIQQAVTQMGEAHRNVTQVLVQIAPPSLGEELIDGYNDAVEYAESYATEAVERRRAAPRVDPDVQMRPPKARSELWGAVDEELMMGGEATTARSRRELENIIRIAAEDSGAGVHALGPGEFEELVNKYGKDLDLSDQFDELGTTRTGRASPWRPLTHEEADEIRLRQEPRARYGRGPDAPKRAYQKTLEFLEQPGRYGHRVNENLFPVRYELELKRILDSSDEEVRRLSLEWLGEFDTEQFDLMFGEGSFRRMGDTIEHADPRVIRTSVAANIIQQAYGELPPDILTRAERLAPVLEQARDTTTRVGALAHGGRSRDFQMLVGHIQAFEEVAGGTWDPEVDVHEALRQLERENAPARLNPGELEDLLAGNYGPRTASFIRPDLSEAEVETLVNTRSFERMYGMVHHEIARWGQNATVFRQLKDLVEPMVPMVKALGRYGLRALGPLALGLEAKEIHRISQIEDPEEQKREIARFIDPLLGVRQGALQMATAEEEPPAPGTAESRQQAARKALSSEDWDERRMVPDPAQMGWKERLDYEAAQQEEKPESTAYEELFPIISQAVPEGVTGYPQAAMRQSAAASALKPKKEERK